MMFMSLMASAMVAAVVVWAAAGSHEKKATVGA